MMHVKVMEKGHAGQVSCCSLAADLAHSPT